MQLYPTRTTGHLAIAGSAVVAIGAVAQEPAIVGWGGAILVAIALARAATLLSVARIRAAGFEMLWSHPKRVVRGPRGGTIEIEAEVRNRDTLAARYVKLRAVASSQIDVRIEPSAGEVAASGRLKVVVRVGLPRVGQHGLHGLALEVRGASGMFEVPLTFANPCGIEVLPRPLAAYLLQPRGGRSRLAATSGRPGRVRGEGTDLRELREHQPGDPFRRIAWKASARRGRLLVRDFEREERDVLWIVLDASVELWAGPRGRAPLDLAIDEAASVSARHLGKGDRVGLLVVAATTRACVPPDEGPAQGQRIAHALVTACACHDAERSDLDESEVAVRVLEHLRPLDPRGLADIRRGDLDKLAARADAARKRAPFDVPAPAGRSLRERLLRRYLASYGIDAPARTQPDRPLTSEAMVRAFDWIARSKPKASLVHAIAIPPEAKHEQPLGEAVKRLARAGASITWSVPALLPSLAPPWDAPEEPTGDDAADGSDAPRPAPSVAPDVAPIAAEAVAVRARVAQARGEAALRRLGIRIVRWKGAAAAARIDDNAQNATDLAARGRELSGAPPAREAAGARGAEGP